MFSFEYTYTQACSLHISLHIYVGGHGSPIQAMDSHPSDMLVDGVAIAKSFSPSKPR